MGWRNEDPRFIGQGGYMPTKAELRREQEEREKRGHLDPKFRCYDKEKDTFDNEGKYESFEDYVKRTKPW